MNQATLNSILIVTGLALIVTIIMVIARWFPAWRQNRAQNQPAAAPAPQPAQNQNNAAGANAPAAGIFPRWMILTGVIIAGLGIICLIAAVSITHSPTAGVATAVGLALMGGVASTMYYGLEEGRSNAWKAVSFAGKFAVMTVFVGIIVFLLLFAANPNDAFSQYANLIAVLTKWGPDLTAMNAGSGSSEDVIKLIMTAIVVLIIIVACLPGEKGDKS